MRRGGAVWAAAVLFLWACGGASDASGPPRDDAAPTVTDTGGGGDGGGERDTATAIDVPVPEDVFSCDPYGPSVICDPPPVRPEHVLDGAFTGWEPGRPCAHEWSCTPNVKGDYAQVWFEYDGEWLRLINDWHLNDVGPISPASYNLFLLWTEDGNAVWEIRVHGDQHVEVVRNGERADDWGVEGAAGFGPSPVVSDREHSIYELNVPTGPGDFGLIAKGPRDPTSGTDDAALWTEPTYVTGTLDEGGGVTERSEPGPALMALVPPIGGPGDVIVLRGWGFGEEVGLVSFNGDDARILGWSDEEVRAEAPVGVTAGPVRVSAHRRWSNALPFALACAPDCFMRECGTDACGGTCGGCDAGMECSNGVCVAICQPHCGGRECGPDGCEGFCGDCAVGIVCLQGLCETVGTPCEPSCAGRFCGDDGCGGTCGTCAEGWNCFNGVCAEICRPDCAERECGPNGCGGICGYCLGAAARCVEGHCVCEPSCAGRECGDDGCGGSCGACPGSDVCQDDGTCGPCVPDCQGRNCGDDGCGGTCGACVGEQEICVSGRCVCRPRCVDLDCGPNGCGGTCGACGFGELCDETGRCVCAPSCAGRVCGDDGCGGTCGECDPGDVCDDAGQCVPKADG